jgi:hypothetical protein
LAVEALPAASPQVTDVADMSPEEFQKLQLEVEKFGEC